MAKEQIITSDIKLRRHAFGMLGMLLLQYILGMTIAFFVQFPESGTPIKFWEFARGEIHIILHMIIGFLLLLGNITLFVRAIIYKNKLWRTASGISLVAIAIAIYTGITFVTSQSDVYSFIMSIGFIIAFITIGWGIYASKK